MHVYADRKRCHVTWHTGFLISSAKRGHNFEEKIRSVSVPVKHLTALTKSNHTVGYLTIQLTVY